MVKTKTSKNEYKYIFCPNHPFSKNNGCIAEHRLMMEKHLRKNNPEHPALTEIDSTKYLRKEWKVHHINGKKDDNRLENFELMSDSKHKSYHMKKFNNPRWNSGRRTKNGYIYLLRQNHPFRDTIGYVAEHHLVMEDYLRKNKPGHPALIKIEKNYYLRRGWIVRRYNKNKSDNRIENLYLVKKGQPAISVASGKTITDKNKKLDFHIDTTGELRVKISKQKYKIYQLVTKDLMCQRQVADKLSISRQSVHEHIRDLEFLGIIKPLKRKANPKFYKSTSIIPVASGGIGKSYTPVISADSRKMERTLGKKPIVVKDKSSGKIKHWRKRKLDLQHRDYDTVVSTAGKRERLCRVHGVAYTCTMIYGPKKDVLWKPVKKGMKGMEQCDLKADVPGIGKVTFRRQKTHTTDELIIWLPEKYFFEWELEEGEKLLEEAVWKARKWFQNKYKTYLGLAVQYRRPEHAFEIFEPAMRQFIHKKGTIKVETTDGMAIADESKKSFPEVEFPTIRQAKAFVEAPDRLIRVETALSKLIDTVQNMAETQDNFTEQVQQLMGLRKEIDKIKEKESQEKMFS